MYDTIVVGGGPAGSRVAARLAAMGHSALVLERKARIGGQKCCTGIIGRECQEAFAIPESVILRPANSATLFSPSGNSLRVWREEPQAYILDRQAFDIEMARQAQAAGAEYVLGSHVTGIQISTDNIQVEADTKFEARAVVIAAGFGGKLAEQVGLGRSADFVAGAQAEVETAGIEEVEVYFGRQVSPGFFGWLVPTSPRTARVGLLSRHEPGKYLEKLIKDLQARGKIISRKTVSHGAIPLKPLRRTYSERLLVVGDAAGQVKPTTGGGIYYGLLCADMAAETLHRALEKDNLAAAELASYERRWRRRLARQLRVGYWARRLFERFTDRQLDRLFTLVKEKGIIESLAHDKSMSFDWHGKIILKLIGHGAIAGMVEAFRLPAWLSKD